MSAVPTKIQAVPVRELYNITIREMLDGLKTNVNILYEDNVVMLTSYKEVILFRYIMDLLAVIPEQPILSKYAIRNYYTNNIYTSKTINKCFEVILEDFVKDYFRPHNSRAYLPIVYAKMYDVFNSIYNELVYSITGYANSISILDFLEIQYDTELLDAIKKVSVENTPDSVNSAYVVLDKIFRTKESLRNNRITVGYISGTFNPNQVKQVLGPRGFITDINSAIYKKPIASSFTLGMPTLYDMAVESCTGAKSLYLSTRAVQTSEYFARELQLVLMFVPNLVDGDCGNTEYVDWYVRTKEEAGKSDLGNLIGKRYLNDNGVEEIITKQHTHIDGTTIKLRSAIKCKVSDKYSICAACFGELSYAIHKHTNLGHICSTTLTQKITQNILSTKHLTSSATSAAITLDTVGATFFDIKDKNTICFKASIINNNSTKVTLVVDQYNAHGISALTKSTNISNYNPNRVSRLTGFILNITDKTGNTTSYPINIRDGNKYGSFTLEFLQHIIDVGYTLDDAERFVIDLTGWKHTLPVIEMPQIEYNFLRLAQDVKAIFKYMKTEIDRNTLNTPTALLQKVFDIVNSKLDVNIALLEVIVYAFTIQSYKDNNYDLGRNSANPALAKIEYVLHGKSMAPVYAWERVSGIMTDPSAFIPNNSCMHPLDIIIEPEAYLEYKNRLAHGKGNSNNSTKSIV